MYLHVCIRTVRRGVTKLIIRPAGMKLIDISPGLMRRTDGRVGMTIMLIILIYRIPARGSCIPVNYYTAHLQPSCKSRYSTMYRGCFEKNSGKMPRSPPSFFSFRQHRFLLFFVIRHNCDIVLIAVLSDSLCGISQWKSTARNGVFF